jgi:hypothetical protein
MNYGHILKATFSSSQLQEENEQNRNGSVLGGVNCHSGKNLFSSQHCAGLKKDAYSMTS